MNVLCTGNKNKPKLTLIVEQLNLLFNSTSHNLFIDNNLREAVNKESYNFLDLYKPNNVIK